MTPQAMFLENESWLRTVVRSRVPEQDAIEDIMQNIALALVKQRETLSQIDRVGAWLYQVAVKQVLMYRRSTGRRRKFEDRLKTASRSGQDATESINPVDRVLAAEQREVVRQAIDQLDDLDRQILMLKYEEGWSYRDLARHMGVKEDTIEYRLLKARKKLRSQLKSHGAEV